MGVEGFFLLRHLYENYWIVTRQLLDKLALPSSMLDSSQLQTELAPSVFALAKAKRQVTLNPERSRLPTLRWQMDGIRTVVCINAESVKEFMAKHGLRQSTPESVQEFIKSLSKDAFDTFMESSAVI